MAFGKKKQAEGPRVDQSNVFELASQALARKRSTRVRLAIAVTLVSPMLMHRWGQKAVLQLVGKMVGQDVPKTDKDLTAEYEQSWYRNTDGDLVVPCRLMKESFCSGGGDNVGGIVSKAQLSRELRVLGHTAPVIAPRGEEVRSMSIEMTRTSTGTPQPTARALIPAGSRFELVVEFPPTLTPDKVMAACQAAGDVIGIGDWRAEKGGEHGLYEVQPLKSDAKEIVRILKACSLPEEKFVLPPEMLRAFNAVPKEKLGDAGRKVRAVVGHVNGQSARSES